MKFYNVDNQRFQTDFNSMWCVSTHMIYSSNMATIFSVLAHMRIVIKLENDKCLVPIHWILHQTINYASHYVCTSDFHSLQWL